jgi:parallel beta-helix repeat protein
MPISRNLIADNIISDFLGTPRDGFRGIWCDGNGDRNTILRNTVFNTHGKGIYIESRCDENTIEHNIVFNNADGGFGTSGYSVEPALHNTYVNNIAFNNGRAGFYFENSWGNTLKNNISYNNRGSQIFVSHTSMSKGGNVFQRNLWYSDSNLKMAIYGDRHKTYRNAPTLRFDQWRAVSGEQLGIYANPSFINAQARDFRLLPASPARGAGEGGSNLGADVADESIR